MNRQRRIDAIARRRAFIDSQMQMLTSTEIRVPNIIRNRTGRPLPNKPRQFPTNFYGVENVLDNSKKSTPFNSVQVVQQQSTSEESVNTNQSLSSNSQSLTEDVYLALLKGDNDGQEKTSVTTESTTVQGGNGESFPIMIPEEIAKMLADAGVTEQSIQSLETIQTHDGTVMVVLDGTNYFGESEAETSDTPELSNLASIKEEVSSPSVPEPVPEAEPNDEEATTEYYEESYVIVQTPDGDVLVPSSKMSMYAEQFQTQSVSSNESIVQIIATESETIEQLISKAKTPEHSHSNKRNPVVPRKLAQNISMQNNKALQRLGASVKTNIIRKPINAKNSTGHKKVNSNGSKTKMSQKKSILLHPKLALNLQSKDYSLSGNITPSAVSRVTTVEEKPRPFRFELPELEDYDCLNNLDDCFMSVPVPIKIGSLQSETGKGKAIIAANSNVAHFSAAGESKEQNGDLDSEMTLTVTDKNAEIGDEGKFPSENLTKLEQESMLECKNEQTQDPEQPSTQAPTKPSPVDHSTNDIDSDINTILQCSRCLNFFRTEDLFSNHVEYCETCPQNNNIHDNEGILSINTDDVENGTNVIVSNSDKRNEETYDNEAVNEGEAIVIKSVNSLSSPVVNSDAGSISSDMQKSSCVELSSPANSSENMISEQSVVESVFILNSSESISNGESVFSFCVQLLDDTEKSNQSPSKKAKYSNNNKTTSFTNPSTEIAVKISEQQSETIASISSATVQEQLLTENYDVGRRTLSKSTANANIISSDDTVSDCVDSCIISSNEVTSEQRDGNGNTVTIQSARIRSRNDRIKAMDKNVTSEEELGFNFRNIFEQVVKQGFPFN